MEIASFAQEDDGRFSVRTLSDISIASNASGKAHNFPTFGGLKHAKDTRVKFLCSHGGKILPRPSDKKLRYAGGETRMISVPRHIHFAALMLKMTEVYGFDVALRYQLPEEDLDALVSVSTDEDLENMMEECDRLDAMEGSSRLRVFVFSPSDLDAVHFSDISDPKLSEQRYVDAVNTVQVDVPFSQNDSIVPPDFYNSSIGIHTSSAWNNAAVQERVPSLPENLNSQVFQLEQVMPLGNFPVSKFPIRGNRSGPIAPPPRVMFTRQWNDHVSPNRSPSVDDFLDLESGESAGSSASSQHDFHNRHRSAANSQVQSHLEAFAHQNDDDQLIAVDARGQMEVPDSKAHSTLAASHLPARMNPDVDDQLYSLESISRVTKPIHETNEEQPLSPGAMLQRQLQVDQHQLGMNFHFRKDEVQLPFDGNARQPAQASQQQKIEELPFHVPGQLPFHTPGQQIEQLPFHSPGHVFIQGGMMAGGHFLSDPLNLPGEVHQLLPGDYVSSFPSSVAVALTGQGERAEKSAILSQQTMSQEPLSCSSAQPHAEYTRTPHVDGRESTELLGLTPRLSAENPSLSLLQRDDIPPLTKMDELDGFLQQLHLSTTLSQDQGSLPGNLGYGRQAPWLLSNFSSFPLVDNAQEVVLNQNMVQNKLHNASGIIGNQLVGTGTGLSLLDEPVGHESKLLNSQLVEMKVDSASAVIRDCSAMDMISDVIPLTNHVPPQIPQADNLTSMDMISDVIPLTNHFPPQIPQADNLTSTLMSSLENLHKKDVLKNIEVDLALAAAGDSRLSLDSNSGDINAGLIQSLVSSKHSPLYQENTAVNNGELEGKWDIEGAVTTADALQPPLILNSTKQHEIWNTTMQSEEEQQAVMLDVSHEKDAKEMESRFIMEKELTSEHSILEVEELDKPMNAAAIAEAEAIARGLQTIRNFDLEELRELGSGTFGTVYHGKWRGTDVAIKRIKKSCFAGRPSERERLIADFWQEAYILGQLHHPNVVAFYGVVPDGPDGTLATVTEYMVNGSLKQALQKQERSALDRRKRLLIAMDAAFGMEYLHKKSVVHFDLKCENLLVNLRDLQRPICKVGDLGLSKVKQQTMISGGVRGTLPWMAPELLNGSSSLVSEKVDVFSFGIVLWELLTGEEPYASMHYGAIIGGIVNNTLRPPVPRWCDAAWKSLMEACWSADPAERPTFSEIASSLRAMEATLNAKGQGQAPAVAG